jgi:hypothetical protein
MNDIIQPLRFYDKVSKQNRNLSWASSDETIFRLIAPNNSLLPFQIRRLLRQEPMVFIGLTDLDGNIIQDLTLEFPPGSLEYVPTSNGDEYFVYYGADLYSNIPPGMFYLTITDGVETWYSEVFESISFDIYQSNCFLRVVWSGVCDYEPYLFNINGQQFNFVMFLDTEIGRPEYENKIEAFEDSNYNITPTFKKMVKRYSFTDVVPEYMVDVFNTLPLAKFVRITDKRYDFDGVLEVTVTAPKWDVSDSESYTPVTVEFESESITVRGCCEIVNKEVNKCLPCSIMVVDFIDYAGLEYTNFEYYNGAVLTQMQDGDMFITDNSGVLDLEVVSVFGTTKTWVSVGVLIPYIANFTNYCSLVNPNKVAFKYGNALWVEAQLISATFISGTTYNLKVASFAGSVIRLRLFYNDGSINYIETTFPKDYLTASTLGIDINFDSVTAPAILFAAADSYGKGCVKNNTQLWYIGSL